LKTYHARRGNKDENTINSAGIKIRSDEVVHHIDEDRSNNHPSNLQIMLDVEHRRYHAKKNKLGQRKGGNYA